MVPNVDRAIKRKKELEHSLPSYRMQGSVRAPLPNTFGGQVSDLTKPILKMTNSSLGDDK